MEITFFEAVQGGASAGTLTSTDAAVVSASTGSAGSLHDAVEDRTEIESTPGQPSETVTSGQFLSAFARGIGVLGTVEALLTQLEGLEGRKALVLLSPGFPQMCGLDDELQRVSTLAREGRAPRGTLRLAREFGCVGAMVDAKPGAVSFYEALGFLPLEILEGQSDSRPAPTALFLPVRDIEAAAKRPR